MCTYVMIIFARKKESTTIVSSKSQIFIIHAFFLYVYHYSSYSHRPKDARSSDVPAPREIKHPDNTAISTSRCNGLDGRHRCSSRAAHGRWAPRLRSYTHCHWRHCCWNCWKFKFSLEPYREFSVKQHQMNCAWSTQNM